MGSQSRAQGSDGRICGRERSREGRAGRKVRVTPAPTDLPVSLDKPHFEQAMRGGSEQAVRARDVSIDLQAAFNLCTPPPLQPPALDRHIGPHLGWCEGQQARSRRGLAGARLHICAVPGRVAGHVPNSEAQLDLGNARLGQVQVHKQRLGCLRTIERSVEARHHVAYDLGHGVRSHR